MAHDRHRGAHAPGPLVQHPDRRVAELDAAVRRVEALQPAAAALGAVADPGRAIQGGLQALGAEPLAVGLVVHALPHLGWYKVQLGGMRGITRCCMISAGGFVPLGPRDTSVVPPNSLVLVYKPRGLGYGLILGVVPPILRSGRVVNPDWIAQGAPAGYRREAGHRHPFSLYQSGGILDFSGQRPVDGTAFERGVLGATGVGWVVSDFEAFLRVNEACGLFLSYIDSHCRLAGVQLDVVSAVHELSCRDDEGESRVVAGHATYPWEALGLYAPGGDIAQVYDDRAVQLDGAVAKLDQPADSADLQPIYRWTEYGGYLGQGHLRLLMKPAAAEGVRRYRDTAADTGLFCESVALDGGYLLQSAKSVTLAKRARIVVPKEVAPPEDGRGDDARAGNYRASGKFGAGPEHRLVELAIPGELRTWRRVAAADDALALAANWKALHPFHYHRGDFATPQEDDPAAAPRRAQEPLDFDTLADESYLPDPEPVTLAIDHRYSEAHYYERTSFLSLNDDGSVVLADGHGAALVMAGGRVRVEAPGGIDLCPGTDLVALADQIVLRARRAVDVSAATRDVRIKAERNVQVLAGNGGTGGILLESKAEGHVQDYAGRTGEDVAASGIVLRAARSGVAALAGRVYLRTGGPGLDPGTIVLDAGRGTEAVQVYGRDLDVFSTDGVGFYLGPTGTTSAVDHAYRFGPDSCLLGADAYLGGTLTCFQGAGSRPALVVDGPVYATGSIASAGTMADRQGMFLGRVPDQFASALTAATGLLAQTETDLRTAAGRRHAATVVDQFYQRDQVGSDATVAALGFSFRDPAAGDQYGTARLRWVERRWEQMARLGGGTGGSPWREPPVVYQGLDTFPWPGRARWRDDPAFLRLPAHVLFDPATGCSVDRPGPYEDPALPDWDAVTMASGYRLIRPDSGA